MGHIFIHERWRSKYKLENMIIKINFFCEVR
ncbi:unnamed protein product [Arabidopsis thaliana]|uniref:Uncharacterized protein n=2 Tax=Arabidopsis thaliana TaxID=3702 RepID=A0A654ENG4_ARATH|nr:unnamed protein product [Arabidopsis thaliana]